MIYILENDPLEKLYYYVQFNQIVNVSNAIINGKLPNEGVKKDDRWRIFINPIDYETTSNLENLTISIGFKPVSKFV